MRRIDAWIGKHLFQPPIILACQLIGITQYAFYRWLWCAIALSFVWRCEWTSWFGSAWLSLFAIARAASLGLNADREAQGSYSTRLIALIMLPLCWPGVASMGQIIAILFAEYALTIRTIPPLGLSRWFRKRAAA